jgi:hypothetical protein
MRFHDAEMMSALFKSSVRRDCLRGHTRQAAYLVDGLWRRPDSGPIDIDSSFLIRDQKEGIAAIRGNLKITFENN